MPTTVYTSDKFLGDYVHFSEDGIYIGDLNGEIVMWTESEWVEDPKVVFSIVNAALIMCLKGSDALKESMKGEWWDRVGICFNCRTEPVDTTVMENHGMCKECLEDWKMGKFDDDGPDSADNIYQMGM